MIRFNKKIEKKKDGCKLFSSLVVIKKEQELIKRDRNKSLKKKWKEMGHDERWVALKPCQMSLCNDYIMTGSIAEAVRRSDGNYTNLQATTFFKTDRALAYMTMMRDKMSAGVKSTFQWKLKKLETTVDSIIGDDPDSVDKRCVNSAISAIGEMNKMQGHYAPTSTIVTNLNADDHLKRINEVANKILNEQTKEIELNGDEVDDE